MSSQTSEFLIGVDIGGTFTDIVAVDQKNGKQFNGKVLTTPQNPSEAVLNGVKEILSKHKIDPKKCRVIHGTTLVANALIERKGAKTALLTTKGFRDVLEIGREWRYDLFALDLDMPLPIVPRNLRFEVSERLNFEGKIIKKLDEKELIKVAKEIKKSGVQTLGIVFLHSFKNSTHEKFAKKIIQKHVPGLNICLSSTVSPEIGEYERTSTCVANAYVQPIFKKYVNLLAKGIKKIGIKNDLFLMLSDGGIVHEKVAVEYPIRLVQSGPAGGAQAATLYGKIQKTSDILCFDMGGTTAKACLIENGKPNRTTIFEVARVFRFSKGSGLPLQVPVVDMIEIGAGGGSIARVDEMGLIQVGPESSSSYPGPACYDLGGKLPTVTDSDLILGYIDPDNFLGGDMKLMQENAENAIREHIAKPMGISLLDAAWAIHEVVTENMSQAATIHALEKGRKIEKFCMIPIGGAGPVHACSMMAKMNINNMISPSNAGVASAIGMIASPNAFELVQADMQNLEDLNFTKIKRKFNSLKKEGEKSLLKTGTKLNKTNISNSLLMRYIGQGYEIEVPINDKCLNSNNITNIRIEFERVYKKLFGRIEKMPLEIISLRTIATSISSQPIIKKKMVDLSMDNKKPKIRKAYFGGKTYLDTPVFQRNNLPKNFKKNGPLIIEERESTLIIPPYFNLKMDFTGNLLIRKANQNGK
jgi:N-methylhydantoinase A